MFLTDSQLGLCSKNVLKIWVNLSLYVLIKKVLSFHFISFYLLL